VDYIKILKDLISIDTAVPPGNNYEKAVDYLKPLFEEAGFKTQKIFIPPEEAEEMSGRVNLLCRRIAKGKQRVIFYTHIDVVPAEGWDAFHPVEQDGKIYGRGAADMKGAIPALLLALDRLKDKISLYDITVMVTTDEEYSQASQLRYLAQFLQPLKGAYFFDLDCNFGYVAITGLGALQMDIEVKGKSVHSGISNLGENAIEKAVLLLNKIVELKKKIETRESKIAVHPDTGMTKMTARLNINMIKGGIKVNIVPDKCVISIDRRLIPEEDIEEARKEIMEACSSVDEVKWEIRNETVIPSLPPCNDKLADKLADIIKEVTGEGGKYGEMGSGDLASIVVNEWHGKHFGSGVIRTENNIHGINEFVYIKDIEDMSEIIYRFLSS
jgi:succinyl-diaminopimelate desuccinylase